MANITINEINPTISNHTIRKIIFIRAAIPELGVLSF